MTGVMSDDAKFQVGPGYDNMNIGTGCKNLVSDIYTDMFSCQRFGTVFSDAGRMTISRL